MSYIVRTTHYVGVTEHAYATELRARQKFEALQSWSVQLVQLLKRLPGGLLVELARRKRTVDGSVSTPVHS